MIITELPQNIHFRMVAYDYSSNASAPHMDAKKQMPSITYMLTKNLYFPPSSIPADTLEPEAAATTTQLEGVDKPEITRKKTKSADSVLMS